jgi:PPM family protein phosphatase
MRMAAISDPGIVRSKNEDAYWCDPDRGIFVVADGLGGLKAGDIAAGTAVRAVADYLVQCVDDQLKDDQLIDSMYEAFRRASQEVYELSSKNEEYRGMACSMSAGIIFLDSCLVGYAGDTRVYLSMGESVHQMTVDDTPVGAMVKRGFLLPEKARIHNLKNFLVKSIGNQPTVEANIIKFPIKANERLLICTDGLWGMLDDRQIAEILARQPDPDEACRNLIEAANLMGGNDNVTAVVINMGPWGEAAIEYSTAEMGQQGQMEDVEQTLELEGTPEFEEANEIDKSSDSDESGYLQESPYRDMSLEAEESLYEEVIADQEKSLEGSESLYEEATADQDDSLYSDTSQDLLEAAYKEISPDQLESPYPDVTADEIESPYPDVSPDPDPSPYPDVDPDEDDSPYQDLTPDEDEPSGPDVSSYLSDIPGLEPKLPDDHDSYYTDLPEDPDEPKKE